MHGEGTYSENNNIRVLASESACGTSVVKQSRYLSWSHPFADASIRLKKKKKEKTKKEFSNQFGLDKSCFLVHRDQFWADYSLLPSQHYEPILNIVFHEEQSVT